MAYEEITYEQEGNVVVVTINRPQAMNALTMKTYGEMEDAVRKVEADHEARVLVITGNGRGFCSGDDVKQVMLDTEQVARRREMQKLQIRRQATPLAAALMNMVKPTIAAVNGAAVGWGMDLALMCDIRIASEAAKFGEIFVLRGLIADLGGLYCLPLVVGLSKAYELLYTGDVISAQEALKIGLVSKVVAPDQLLPEAKTLAQRIAANPPLAVQRTKEAVRRGLDPKLGALAEYHSDSLAVLFQTEDHKEGATAFIEKRQPVFKGR